MRPLTELHHKQLAKTVARQHRRRLSLPLADPPPRSTLDSFWALITRAHLQKPTSDQRQSLLITKLPKEIYLLIYEALIGSNKVHLCTFDAKLGCIVCHPLKKIEPFYGEELSTDDESIYGKLCRFGRTKCRWITYVQACLGCETHYKGRGMRVDNVISVAPEKVVIQKSDDFLSFLCLLQTYRVIYTEAIPLLYSTPIFSTHDIYTTLNFFSTIPTCRLQHIRTFQVD